MPELPAALPTFPEFEAIFPARTDIPLAWLLRPYREDTVEPPAAQLSEELEHLEPEEPRNPWLGRLRSSSSLAVEARSLADAPPLPPPRVAPPDTVPPVPPVPPVPRPAAPRRIYPVGQACAVGAAAPAAVSSQPRRGQARLRGRARPAADPPICPELPARPPARRSHPSRPTCLRARTSIRIPAHSHACAPGGCQHH